MVSQAHSGGELHEPIFRARDLREVAGLSYRQLNDWDKRGAFPHQRTAKGEWRRVNALQAMALRIVSELRRRFGIPLQKQHHLLRWMFGEAPAPRDYVLLDHATDLLFAFTPEEEARGEGLDAASKRAHRELARRRLSDRDLGSRGADPAASGGHRPQVEYSEEAHMEVMSLAFVPRLVGRGWPPAEAQDFARRFSALSVLRNFGLDSFSEVAALLKAAEQNDDELALLAARTLGSALLPLYEALGLMTTGFPVFLLTDLDQALFLSEDDLFDMVRESRLPSPALILQVSDHINVVLRAAGKEPLEVTRRTADLHRTDDAERLEKERRVLAFLQARDFDCVTIESEERCYRMIREPEMTAQDERWIAEILASHHYRSITVEKGDDEPVRLAGPIRTARESED